MVKERPAEKLFNKHKNSVLKLYFQRNFTYAMIYDKFGIQQSACSRFFKSQGIKARRHGWKLNRESPIQDFLRKNKKKIIKLYFKNRYSSAMLAEKFHTSQTAIMRFFQIHKIKMRKEGWDAPDNSTYTYDNNFFRTPNILNSYWAGFISADGCIYDRYKKGKSLVITIAQKDEIILKRFKRDIKYTGRIKKYEGDTNYGHSKSCRLSIHNKNIVDDLRKNWNITQRKTFTLLPNKKNKNFKLFLSFLIGYIDGDGCVTYFGENREYLKISINGTKGMLQWFKDTLTKRFNQDFGKMYPEKSIYVLSIHRINQVKLIHQESNKIPIKKMDRKWSIIKKYSK